MFCRIFDRFADNHPVVLDDELMETNHLDLQLIKTIPLFPPVSGTYLLKLQQPSVLDVVNRNRHIMEPYSDIADDALLNFCENIRSTRAPFS